ncbi:MAG: flavodoxin-dependent (E)-4-hydroxy-3-methylbut-2-enyl-diphosphate synthase, partial [Desulfobacteraceae bacterium]|nr:flavodoxin-dependent (E)-4-hydroxy-3-methylbut-2-enyl-diphosphate synthase [Desulfobacteraceae bacterium]
MPIVKKRKKTQQINIGSVKVGGDAPIAVQSMTNTYTQDVISTVSQINQLSKAGCEIIRVAIPDMEAALAVKEIKEQIDIPLIADIHFDYRLAIASVENGADALRINPGNIGSKTRVEKVVKCAKDNGVAI